MTMTFIQQPTDVWRDKEFAQAVSIHDDINPEGTVYVISAYNTGQGTSNVYGTLARYSDVNGNVEFPNIVMTGGSSGYGIGLIVTCDVDGGQVFSSTFTVFKLQVDVIQQPENGSTQGAINEIIATPIKLVLTKYPYGSYISSTELVISLSVGDGMNGTTSKFTDINGEALFDNISFSTAGEKWPKFAHYANDDLPMSDIVTGNLFHIAAPQIPPNAPTNLKFKIIKLYA